MARLKKGMIKKDWTHIRVQKPTKEVINILKKDKTYDDFINEIIKK